MAFGLRIQALPLPLLGGEARDSISKLVSSARIKLAVLSVYGFGEPRVHGGREINGLSFPSCPFG